MSDYLGATTGKSAPMYYPVCDRAGNIKLLSTLRTFEHNGVTFTLKNAERIEGENWVEAYARNPGMPLDPSDVVWPSPLWPRDEWGRGLSVLEVDRGHHLSRKVAA